eukprot:10732758-Alexandrium_andersonii.AAC.1
MAREPAEEEDHGAETERRNTAWRRCPAWTTGRGPRRTARPAIRAKHHRRSRARPSCPLGDTSVHRRQRGHPQRPWTTKWFLKDRSWPKSRPSPPTPAHRTPGAGPR